MLAPAAVTSEVGPYVAALVVGFAIGITGHVIRSRPLILAGILIVGGAGAYFTFVVAKVR